jgi:hypothetical protein
MTKKPKFKPQISRVKLNPEQAVLSCSCYGPGNPGDWHVRVIFKGAGLGKAISLEEGSGNCGGGRSFYAIKLMIPGDYGMELEYCVS